MKVGLSAIAVLAIVVLSTAAIICMEVHAGPRPTFAQQMAMN
jgi:hypothetical protein